MTKSNIISTTVHRDLAARNVLLTENMEAVVSDFGFSRVVAEDTSSAQTKSEIGPLKWMAPERYKGFCVHGTRGSFTMALANLFFFIVQLDLAFVQHQI